MCFVDFLVAIFRFSWMYKTRETFFCPFVIYEYSYSSWIFHLILFAKFDIRTKYKLMSCTKQLNSVIYTFFIEKF